MDHTQTQANLEACVRALDELLTAMIDHEQDEAAQARRQRLRDMLPEAVVPMERIGFRTMTTDPVRTALREGAKRLGREIYSLDGLGAMIRAMNSVADMDSANADRREAILDGVWNGIGDGDTRWAS